MSPSFSRLHILPRNSSSLPVCYIQADNIQIYISYPELFHELQATYQIVHLTSPQGYHSRTTFSPNKTKTEVDIKPNHHPFVFNLREVHLHPSWPNLSYDFGVIFDASCFLSFLSIPIIESSRLFFHYYTYFFPYIRYNVHNG